jgi:hypothetical protein
MDHALQPFLLLLQQQQQLPVVLVLRLYQHLVQHNIGMHERVRLFGPPVVPHAAHAAAAAPAAATTAASTAASTPPAAAFPLVPLPHQLGLQSLRHQQGLQQCGLLQLSRLGLVLLRLLKLLKLLVLQGLMLLAVLLWLLYIMMYILIRMLGIQCCNGNVQWLLDLARGCISCRVMLCSAFDRNNTSLSSLCQPQEYQELGSTACYLAKCGVAGPR